MFIHDNISANDKNHLVMGGCDLCYLADKYKTPLYVMDEEKVRDNMRAYKNAIEDYYNSNGMVLYASKALSNLYMYKIAKEEGIGVDVVSGGELYTALKAGFDASKIYFHGNNKTYDEIELGIKSKIACFVADSINELDMIDRISGENNTVTNVMFRIKPGVDAHTHEFIATGQIDSKFGFAIENNEAYEIIKYAKNLKNIMVVGIHCHIGSQIFELEPFCEAARIMIKFMTKVKNELGVNIKRLNLGGGFGIKYVKEDTPVVYPKYIEAVSKVLKEECEKEGVDLPYVLMEPGRSVVGDAGVTLYTVGSIKEIKDVRKYVSVDGGMGDNPRYILYEAEYDAAVANRADAKEEEVVTVCGKCCESGDIIMKDAKLPKLKSGDILCVMSTGAYNYSMSSNYNRICRPAMVFVSGGKEKLAVKRETYEDLIRNDLM
ncbi:MAG: diaminopimelate decarboxylase [Ruminococcaceae bacterium]|nr:diaminopimelate decarboxylase [Oscillospiraceae bacterium]